MIIQNNKKTFQLADILICAFIMCATVRTLEPIPNLRLFY